MRRALASVVVAAFALAACASSAGSVDPQPACMERAAWPDRTSAACTQCLGDAVLPACSCRTDPGAAACATQQQAQDLEPDCADVQPCLLACAGDCACVGGCYAGHDACRHVAANLQGCLIDVCATACGGR